VINLSEGRDTSVISAIAGAAVDHVLHAQSDPDHHRAVLTLGGTATEEAARSIARRAVELIDIRFHDGVHPRMGALDVVPFVPLGPDGTPVPPGGDLTQAIAARGRFARWAAEDLALPCFFYGPERSLPDVRRLAFAELVPDTGPSQPHPTAGACAVGARFALVAYNLWLSTPDTEVARAIAREVRGPTVRALGLAVAGVAQVSCNLIDPQSFGPAQAFDTVDRLAHELGTEIARAELVGLVPAQVIASTPSERRLQLDLHPERTIEARLLAAQGTC
jgi:glutamate formiminotransferase